MSDDTDRSPGRAINLADHRLLSSTYAYALDAIGDAERTDIDAKLRAAPEETRCEFDRAVREVRETMALVAAAATTAPSPVLRSRILEALDCVTQERPTAGPVTPSYRHPPRRSRWRLAAAAATIAVAVGGVAVGEMAGNSGSRGTEEVLVARDSRTATVDVSRGGTATVTYSHEEDAAVVRLDGVPLPDEGSVYQVWLLTDLPHSAGTITASDLTSDNRRIVTGLGDSTSFAITVEPADGSDTPTAKPMALVPLHT